MTVLKLTRIGDSVGVSLPEEVLARVKVEQGDRIFLTEVPASVLPSPYKAATEEQLRLGREFMREFRDTFHRLAE